MPLTCIFVAKTIKRDKVAGVLSQRRRAIVFAVGVVVVSWMLAWLGHTLARNARMTADKFRRYVQSVDFSRLQGQERAKALRALADKLNALPPDERREIRLNREWEGWFSQMTEAEKEAFVEATFPAGVKQMISVFEKMSAERRKRTIDEALRRLREQREQGLDSGGPPRFEAGSAGNPPPISPELEARIRTLGLRTFFAESSAQTKAEVAPLLEEIQRIVAAGGRPGGRRR